MNKYFFFIFITLISFNFISAYGFPSEAGSTSTTITLTNGTVFNHNDLQSIQGGTTNEYYHFTSAQHTSIIAGLTSWISLAVEYLTSSSNYITVNNSSGSVLIGFDESVLNNTIQDLDTDTTYTAGEGLNLTGTVFSTDMDLINRTIEDKDIDTNLTEDNVEAYIFDNDNTANLNMSTYNITMGDAVIYWNGTHLIMN